MTSMVYKYTGNKNPSDGTDIIVFRSKFDGNAYQIKMGESVYLNLDDYYRLEPYYYFSDSDGNVVNPILTGGKGDKGETGASAYDSWIMAGNTGNVAAFLASLVGPQGIQGVPGAALLTGTTAPADALGSNGQHYYDYVAHKVYGPKTSGTWPAGVSLIGPKGDQGDASIKATTTVHGIGKVSVAPVNSGDPIFVGDNDPRNSDQRTPPDGSVTLAKIAAALKGGASAGVEALRALGTTSTTAAAGNDPRLSDTRTPSAASVVLASIAASLRPSGTAATTDEALRALGATPGTAAPGNDSRFYIIPTFNISANYTLALTEIGRRVRSTGATNLVLTVPNSSAVNFPTDIFIPLLRAGTGTMTVAPASGVTINNTKFIVGPQYAGAGLHYNGSNNWDLVGSLV